MTDIVRYRDWSARLTAYVAAHADARYELGTMDCGLFIAGAAETMTGFDPAAPFRGTYRTKAEMAESFRENGAGSLKRTLNSLFPRIKPGFAQRGDLAWFRRAVGIVMGSYALFVTDNGLVRIPRADWTGAWRV